MGLLQSLKSTLSRSIAKDSWVSAATGLGAIDGKVQSTNFWNIPQGKVLPISILRSMYKYDDITARLVDLIVDESMRRFIDCELGLKKELERVKSQESVIQAAKSSRVYGNSLLVAYVDDGRELHEELDFKNVRKLIGFKVYEREEIAISLEDLVVDFYNENFGEPRLYTITTAGREYKIHRSRAYLFRGKKLTNHERNQNNGFDQSVLESVYTSIRNYACAMNAAGEMIQDFNQRVIKVDGLSSQIGSSLGLGGFLQKYRNIERSAGVRNSIYLDKSGSEGDEYEKHIGNISGIPEMCDRYAEAICAGSGIPASKLFGRPPKGLSATSDRDIQNWYDCVDAYRNEEIRPVLDWQIKIIKAQSFLHPQPDNFHWQFRSLHTPTDEEVARIRKLNLEADKIAAEIDMLWIDRGAIDPSKLYQVRYKDHQLLSELDIENEESEENYEDVFKSEETSVEEFKNIDDFELQSNLSIKPKINK